MKHLFRITSIIAFTTMVLSASAQLSENNATGERLYIDVHRLEPGKVKYEDVAAAHAKDLAVQGKYDVEFLEYWVDESKGLVYCLSSAHDSLSITKAHAEAHGLLPSQVYQVTEGTESEPTGKNGYFLDVHYLGAGNVTATAVAAAHEKDLVAQKQHGVNFINYWVDEEEGMVMCLSQAKDADAIIQTHKEAHGLLPDEVMEVKPGK